MVTQPVPVLDMALSALTFEQAVAVLEEAIDADERRVCSVVNAGKWSRMQRDSSLARAVRGSDWLFADGASVVWASRALGHAVPERVCGVDLMMALLQRCSNRGWRPFLLGSTPSGIGQTASRAAAHAPGLQLAGWHHGYFSDDEEPQVAQLVHDSRPDVVFVGMGTPRQERFIARWLNDLDVPLCMGVGGGLDVLGGSARRAPRWMQQANLEWAYRLAHRPRVLWRRALLDPMKLAWATGRAATTTRE